MRLQPLLLFILFTLVLLPPLSLATTPSELQAQIELEEKNQSLLQTLDTAANAGDIEAMNALGQMYETGTDVSKDLKQARKWYVQAANQGSANAQYALARFYREGLGVSVDRDMALIFLRKAASQDYPPALCELGMIYVTDTSSTEHLPTGLDFIKRAAIKGYAACQYQLAQWYFSGTHLELNHEKALAWCQKALEQHFPESATLCQQIQQHSAE